MKTSCLVGTWQWLVATNNSLVYEDPRPQDATYLDYGTGKYGCDIRTCGLEPVAFVQCG